MGTNYFAVKNKPSCTEPLHIGKASIGTMFLFAEQNGCNDHGAEWYTFKDVKKWLEKNVLESRCYVIVDEEDSIVGYDRFMELVDFKQKKFKDNPDNFKVAENHLGYRFMKGWFR